MQREILTINNVSVRLCPLGYVAPKLQLLHKVRVTMDSFARRWRHTNGVANKLNFNCN
jgi:hypothetical protein